MPTGTLFDLIDADDDGARPDSLAEFVAQRAAVAAAGEPARIDRLLAAESAGALIAIRSGGRSRGAAPRRSWRG